jgi:hypothetical protein
MKELYYKVADHVFALETGSDENIVFSLRQYEPFGTDPTEDTVFRLKMSDTPIDTDGFSMEMQQDDEGQAIQAGHIGERPCFLFFHREQLKAVLVCSTDYRRGEVFAKDNNLFGINNALMVLYALTTAGRHTALFHSSVVSHEGKAYMFLGPSGTGKSTHSRLWLEHIEGTELMNDDNPVVRIFDDGSIRVFGSPWSGKTPCYRNVSYPLGAIVMLDQAPRNVIRQLKPLEAYAALMISISGKRWDKQLAEGLHETESLLVANASMWHLDCLPDEEAARVCYKSLSPAPSSPLLPPPDGGGGLPSSGEEGQGW